MAGNDDPLDHRLQHVVAGNADAFPEGLGRGERPVVLLEIGGDHQIGCAAADIDAGDAQRFLHGRVGCGGLVGGEELPGPSEQVEQAFHGAAEFLRDLAIEPDQMHARGLRPTEPRYGGGQCREAETGSTSSSPTTG